MHHRHLDLDWIRIGLLFAAGVLLLTVPRFVYWLNQRRMPIRQVCKRFEPRPSTPDGQPPYFKRKIRVGYLNVSEKTIEVEAPGWVAEVGDLAIQPPEKGLTAASGVRLEDKDAGGWKADKWEPKDAQKRTVTPGYVFEVWVGLSHKYTDSQLERHKREGKIGTLVLSVTMGSERRELRVRVT